MTFYQKYVCISREHDGYKFLNNSQDAHEIKKITENFVFFDYAKGRRKKIVDHKKLLTSFVVILLLMKIYMPPISLNPSSHGK